jgi:hypothetical protein
VRTTVAVTLLAGATVVVALAVGSGRLAGPAAVVALAAGIAATRIVATELAQSRRDAASERAVLARAYQQVAARRSREHARLTAASTAATAAAMTDRLADRERVIAGLRRSLSLTQRRLGEAELRLALAEPVDEPHRLAGWDAARAPRPGAVAG